MTDNPSINGSTATAPTLAAQLASLAQLVAEPAENPGDPIAGVLQVVTTVVPGARWATLTERNSRGIPRTVSTTDPVAQEVDVAQYRLGEGPTLEAMRRGSAVMVRDLRTDVRWPRLSEIVVQRTPVRGVLSYPLRGAGPVTRTLNLYAEDVEAFAGAATTVAAVTMASTETALAGLAQRARAANLHRALMSNRRIGVAIGILMARSQWTEDQAFAAMCEASQALNRKLRDLAEEVALTGALPELPIPAPEEPAPAVGLAATSS
ncbi:GAF and ANTAR domain-containing protein [Nakamurella deserti]|uniref:GAF and ANTAR domain-containing protein n=1 Tax=Nakamurella deserti TaxID=2164074 RepID=UPI000DBE6A27|nr:GAF and ANTAR domain-containing protein [Nakamurella deserti]